MYNRGITPFHLAYHLSCLLLSMNRQAFFISGLISKSDESSIDGDSLIETNGIGMFFLFEKTQLQKAVSRLQKVYLQRAQ